MGNKEPGPTEPGDINTAVAGRTFEEGTPMKLANHAVRGPRYCRPIY